MSRIVSIAPSNRPEAAMAWLAEQLEGARAVLVVVLGERAAFEVRGFGELDNRDVVWVGTTLACTGALGKGEEGE